jgi:DNA-binding transcriptional LysR family regulator
VIGFATSFLLKDAMPRPVSLSPELLQTFISVVRHDGDAVAAAAALGINQPSMSKRLAQLQHAGRVLRKPWLERHGKTWKLTDEGRRMLPTVEDVVYRYDQLRKFADAPLDLAVACGQDAAGGLILETCRRFRKHHPQHTVRVATPRGRARIEGVAGGLYELAIVTHSADQIREAARRELIVEELYTDPLVLAYASSAPFADSFDKLPERVTAKALSAFPLALPETDSALREDFESKTRVAGGGALLRPVIEGGWSMSLRYVAEGFAVGVLPRSVVASAREPLMIRGLAREVTPPNTLRLITRKRHDAEGGHDLTSAGKGFYDTLREVAPRFAPPA